MRAPGLASSLVAAALTLALAAAAHAELRISDLEAFLNDFEVTVHVVLLGTLPEAVHEGVRSGLPAHVKFTIDLWQFRRYWPPPLPVTQAVGPSPPYTLGTNDS